MKILVRITILTLGLQLLGCGDESAEILCDADMMCQPACDYDPDCADSVNRAADRGDSDAGLGNSIIDSGERQAETGTIDIGTDSGVTQDSSGSETPEKQHKTVKGLLSGGTCNSACERESYECDDQCDYEDGPSAGIALYQDSNLFVREVPIANCDTEIEDEYIYLDRKHTLWEYRCCCLAPFEIPITRIKGSIFVLKSCDDVCSDNGMACVPDASWGLIDQKAGALLSYVAGSLTVPRPGSCTNIPNMEFVDEGRDMVLSEYECACREE